MAECDEHCKEEQRLKRESLRGKWNTLTVRTAQIATGVHGLHSFLDVTEGQECNRYNAMNESTLAHVIKTLFFNCCTESCREVKCWVTTVRRCICIGAESLLSLRYSR